MLYRGQHYPTVHMAQWAAFFYEFDLPCRTAEIQHFDGYQFWPRGAKPQLLVNNYLLARVDIDSAAVPPELSVLEDKGFIREIMLLGAPFPKHYRVLLYNAADKEWRPGRFRECSRCRSLCLQVYHPAINGHFTIKLGDKTECNECHLHCTWGNVGDALFYSREYVNEQGIEVAKVDNNRLDQTSPPPALPTTIVPLSENDFSQMLIDLDPDEQFAELARRYGFSYYEYARMTTYKNVSTGKQLRYIENLLRQIPDGIAVEKQLLHLWWLLSESEEDSAQLIDIDRGFASFMIDRLILLKNSQQQ